MRRRKRKNKQTKIIFITSLSLLFILTVGYAAFSTNLNITAKGNILNTDMTTKELKEKYCNQTTGDGLYKDTYEEGRCIYKGSNPNNYITFNNESWRIIAIEKDETLKIMKNGSIGNIAWDSSNSNNWTRPATLNTYLNGEYYESLNEEAKKQIVNHDFPIGPVTWSNDNLAEQINLENSEKWNGKIALMSASDYFRANTNTAQCGTFKLQYSNATCAPTNYIYSMAKITGDNTNVWMINRRNTDTGSYTSYVVLLGGSATTGNQVNQTNMGVLPTVFISKDIKLKGEGTETNPYKIN